MKEFATSTLRLIPKIVQVSMWLWGVNHLIGRLLPAFLTTGFNVNKKIWKLSFSWVLCPHSDISLSVLSPGTPQYTEFLTLVTEKKMYEKCQERKGFLAVKSFWKKSSVKTMQKYSYPIELNFKGRTFEFFSSNFNLTNIFYYAK